MSEGIKESETEARKIYGVRQLLQPSYIECEINQIDVGNFRQTTDYIPTEVTLFFHVFAHVSA